MGSDLKLAKASFGADWMFSDGWRVTIGLRRWDRDSDDPSEECSATAVFVGVSWSPGVER
jgi:hypothetical protein